MNQRPRMHDDEVFADAALVRRLLAMRTPEWADLRLALVPSAGTQHALYRLGEDKVVRLPRTASAHAGLAKEARWLPRLAPELPLAVPVPLALGEPAEDYPWSWCVFGWLDGQDADSAPLADPARFVDELAAFVRALQAIEARDGPSPGVHNFGRGVPLAARDRATREAIGRLGGHVDVAAVTAEWEAALATPAWAEPPVWIHGDLAPGNLLVRDGRLHAVIDFGGLGVGDPAADLIVAWNFLSAAQRPAYRDALGVDDATWARGRGWALSVALIQLPYYLETNPSLVANSRFTIDAILGARERSA